VHFPVGSYVVGTSIVITNTDYMGMTGDSAGTAEIVAKSGVAFTAPLFSATNCQQWEISNIVFGWNGNAACNPYPLVMLDKMLGLRFLNNIIQHDGRGLNVKASVGTIIDGNRMSMQTPINTPNYNLQVDDDINDPLSLSETGTVNNNVLFGSGAFFACRAFVITNNLVSGSLYRAGISTGTTLQANTTANKAYVGHTIANNTCRLNIGKDSLGPVSGMILYGQYHVVEGNNCHSNGGPGIVWSAWRSVLTSNFCWNNGLEVTATAAEKSGIHSFAGVDIIARPDYSFVSGNFCTAQDYGYTESPDLTLMTVADNDFTGNAVGQVLLNPLNLLNTYDIDLWVPFTPAVIASVGTITTLGAITAAYLRHGVLVFYNINIRITTNGTGAGELLVSLPFSNQGPVCILSGRGGASNTVAQVATIALSSNTARVTDYLGAYPGGDGFDVRVSGFCTL